MVPKVDFQIHDLLVQTFLFPALWGSDRTTFDARASMFINNFLPYEEKVLNLIEKFSGFNWSKNRIPVFLIPDGKVLAASFAKPNLQDGLPGIVQKIKPDGEFRDFCIFVHELCHINQKHSDFESITYGIIQPDQTRNIERIELAADIVGLYVLREIFGENSSFERDFLDFLENTHAVNKAKFDQLQKHLPLWNLNKEPLKNYLKQ